MALRPCPPADNIDDGLCAELEVYEDRDAATGPRRGHRAAVPPIGRETGRERV
mgnify:CR=1 FL=1